MKYYLLFSLLFLLPGCKTNNPQQEALQTIKAFLAWYETHYSAANAFPLVNQGNEVYYSVNFEECEKFLAYLKSSGYVSDSYLDNFRTHFKNAQAEFEREPQNDGPPPGFDYDIVLLTQEPEWIFEHREKTTLISSEVQANKAILNLEIGFKLQFTLSKQNDRWLIDAIAYFEE
jgi:hypothetical protein